MAEIRPFRMVHYNGNCAADLDKLIAPPYDVISEEQQEGFYQAHPYNIIRLVLGKTSKDDTEADNRYTRARQALSEWMSEGVFTRRDRPGFTVYQMDYELPEGGRRIIDGIVSLVKVDDYGVGKVLPHEKTYKGPKQDQLDLMRACKANMTPIHALFEDASNEIAEQYKPSMDGPPEQETVDSDGTVHRTWSIRDDAAVSRITKLLDPKSIFIADGHHRYETARAYKKEMDEASGSNASAAHNHVMMYLTSMSHPGLCIRPAHRMIKGLTRIDLEGFWRRLKPCFEKDAIFFSETDMKDAAQKLLDRVAARATVGGKFGMYVHGENCFRLMRVKGFDRVETYIDQTIPGPLKTLDVTILRELVIARGLEIDKEDLEKHMEYAPSAEEALEKARRGDVQISFIMNPTRVEQMREAAELGYQLPHKSTYFYPKVSSGLVLNVF